MKKREKNTLMETLAVFNIIDCKFNLKYSVIYIIFNMYHFLKQIIHKYI